MKRKLKVIENMATNKQIVNKDYALINARYKLSNVQTKIILKIISLIKNKEDTDFMVYQLPLSIFDFLTDNKNHERLKKECKRLMEKVLEIDTGNGWLLTHWFSSIEYKQKENIIEASIDPKLKPYLLQLKKNFKWYELNYVMKMESEYSIRIYEICKQYEKLGTRKIELQELYDTLQVPKSYRDKFKDFRVKVLEVSKKEINKYSDIEIDYIPKKRGRATYWIEFVIKANPNNIAETKAKNSEVKNEDIKDLEQFREMFAKFKFNIKEFDLEFENFKIYNDNNLEKITLDNFKKWCMQKKRKQTQVQATQTTNAEKQAYRWEFKKAKAISDKIKDWLDFDLGVDWLNDYYLKDIKEFEVNGIKFSYQDVMHPDFNKNETLLFKLNDENGEYLLKHRTDDVLDVELIEKD